MKTFKDIKKYGDLTGETFEGDITIQSYIRSLEGSPKIIDGDFECDACRVLETLKHSPEIVNGNFSCTWCIRLTTLEGSPKIVNGGFNCNSCRGLETLKGAPKPLMVILIAILAQI